MADPTAPQTDVEAAAGQQQPQPGAGQRNTDLAASAPAEGAAAAPEVGAPPAQLNTQPAAGEGGQPAPSVGAEPSVQETQAPTHPAPGTSGPQDALAATSNPTPAGGVPAANPSGPVTQGPEDAMDPGEKIGDYTGRVDDAAHFTHQPIPEDELVPGGPLTRPVPQNNMAAAALQGEKYVPPEAEYLAAPPAGV